MTRNLRILEQLAFPAIDDQQLAHLRSAGTVRDVSPGDVLAEVGASEYGLVVVLEGSTDIVDRVDDNHRLRTIDPGGFDGELGLLTGERTLTACVVRSRGRVVIVPPAALREIIATEAELGNLLVTAFAARRQLLMLSAVGSVTLIGPSEDPEVLRLLEFADRNRIPYRWLDPHNPHDTQSIATCGAPEGDAFRAVLGNRRTIERPTPLAFAKAVGLERGASLDTISDLIVVGAGPAGLAAAVYGASEGLSTLVVEDTAIGGQAGTSSRIENYVGFPAGLSGGDLAFRAEVQAIKFGARITVPRRALAVEQRDNNYAVRLDDGSTLRARSVVIATGARYRRLSLPGQEPFEGAGIYYAATDLEARRCRGKAVSVVGGGNSAGQAALFLSECATCVHLICRGTDLAESMSQYLVTRLQSTPNVRIRLHTEAIQVRGHKMLENVTLLDRSTSECQDMQVCALFVMIGADPCTSWLHGTIAVDEKGFVRTGVVPASRMGALAMTAAPSPYGTELPGIFAVGDVRSGSVKRVASAVGEGSVVVRDVHLHLASISAAPRVD